MTARLNSFMENHPAFGWIGSALSFVTGLAQWFIDHADDFTKIIGCGTVLLGFIAGYYTLRIQRRAWHKAQREEERHRALD